MLILFNGQGNCKESRKNSEKGGGVVKNKKPISSYFDCGLSQLNS